MFDYSSVLCMSFYSKDVIFGVKFNLLQCVFSLLFDRIFVKKLNPNIYYDEIIIIQIMIMLLFKMKS